MAEALAADLEQRGFGVWWDAELVESDNFQDAILAALSRAKAAIVIWTKNSVTSNFVRDEARYALFHNKLIATKAGELDVIEIPFGFQSQHTEDVLNRDNILRALKKLGVQPLDFIETLKVALEREGVPITTTGDTIATEQLMQELGITP